MGCPCLFERSLLQAYPVIQKVEVYTFAAVLAEMDGKLREKFHREEEWIKRAVRHVAVVDKVVKPDARLAILKDEPGNRILECVRHAGAEVIVTGDRHLLSLESFEGIRIVILAGFLDQEHALLQPSLFHSL
jgi:predicted nucleic acid-binding protein